MTQTNRRDWRTILAHAAEIVLSYDTSVTLRQLFYRLVSDGTLLNKSTDYKSLSMYTARARRGEEQTFDGRFPSLIDRTRAIERDQTFASPEDAASWLGSIYRRDRTEGQAQALYLAVEKAGIVEQLRSWFGELGLPILALQGNASQSFVEQVVLAVADEERPAVLIYAGDFDPSGEDIDRDFVARTGCWADVRRIALLPEQIVEHDLPVMLGKATDSRAGAFIERHGRLVQVELDALPPDVLRKLYAEAIDDYFDHELLAKVIRREQRERKRLTS